MKYDTELNRSSNRLAIVTESAVDYLRKRKTNFSTDVAFVRPEMQQASAIAYQRICAVLGVPHRGQNAGFAISDISSYAHHIFASYPLMWTSWLDGVWSSLPNSEEWSTHSLHELLRNLGSGVGEAFYLSDSSVCRPSDWLVAAGPESGLVFSSATARYIGERLNIDSEPIWAWLVASELAYWRTVTAVYDHTYTPKFLDSVFRAGKEFMARRISVAQDADTKFDLTDAGPGSSEEFSAALNYGANELRRLEFQGRVDPGKDLSELYVIHSLVLEIISYSSLFMNDLIADAALTQNSIDELSEGRTWTEGALLGAMGLRVPIEIQDAARIFVRTLVREQGRTVLPRIFSPDHPIPSLDELRDPNAWIARVSQ